MPPFLSAWQANAAPSRGARRPLSPATSLSRPTAARPARASARSRPGARPGSTPYCADDDQPRRVAARLLTSPRAFRAGFAALLRTASAGFQYPNALHDAGPAPAVSFRPAPLRRAAAVAFEHPVTPLTGVTDDAWRWQLIK